MSEELIIDGKEYISSKRASELSGYSQDYIGQLSRGGQIEAKRVGGLWYISVESLQKHREKAETYNPAPPPHNNGADEADAIISFDGKSYVSAANASKLTGYTQDYVGQLARGGDILARQIGNRWYIEREGILEHKKSKDSLLAAVQTESVGLKHRTSQESVGAFRTPVVEPRIESEPLLAYTSDDRELMPVIKAEERNERTEEPDPVEHPIPIHVVQAKMPIRSANDKSYSIPKGLGLRLAYRPKNTALVIVAASVLVVVAIGFVSLKGSAMYTVNREKSAGDSVQTASVSDAGASARVTAAASRVIDALGAFLEEHFVPELIYKQI